MAQKAKFYVVWRGTEPGVYGSWDECRRRVEGFPGAAYKSFRTEAEARAAFEAGVDMGSETVNEGQETAACRDAKYCVSAPAAARVSPAVACGPAGNVPEPARNVCKPAAPAPPRGCPPPPPDYRHDTVLPLPPEVPAVALAVDAACSGNPGPMEYRGVYLATGQEVFRFGPVHGTNNIGEFLAIVHALALLKQRGAQMPVYSDSRNALLWVRARKCRTKLERTPRTEELFRLIGRAETWLRTHQYADIPLRKWETDRWGEVPADFGRK